MSYILNIDTAVQTASVCLAENDKSIGIKINPSQKDHAAWLHVAIEDLLKEKGLALSQLNAIAVSSGPGSYTGLRVSMAAAKGLCYALQIPLITINTLQMMAAAAVNDTTDLLCPMIDARRMEVFVAVFDSSLHEVLPSTNIIITETSFQDLLEKHKIRFFGNGSKKFQLISKNTNGVFEVIDATAENMVKLAFQKLKEQAFADLAYAEPFYGKEFYTPFIKPQV